MSRNTNALTTPCLADVRPVERITSLSRDEFRAHYLAASRPVVVTGGVRQWPAVQQWTLESLVERLGERPVIVGLSTDGVFNYDLEASRINYVSMPFSAAAARLLDRNAREVAYIMQRPVELELDELMRDVSPPDMLTGELSWPHFWAGGAGVATPLHWDNLQNLYGQIIGRKRFLLAAPDDLDKLYPYPASARFAHISYANPDDPEPWPRIQDVSWLECVVEPGDLLFLPAFWWHHVRSLDVAVSVNYWWSPGLSHCLVPAFLRSLVAIYPRDRLAGVGSPVTTFPGGPLGAARFSLRRGHPRFSLLFAAKSLEDTVRQRCRDRGVAIDEDGQPRDLRVLIAELDARGAWPGDAPPLFSDYEVEIDAALDGADDNAIDAARAAEFLALVTDISKCFDEETQPTRNRDG
jgi:hypothetical protein